MQSAPIFHRKEHIQRIVNSRFYATADRQPLRIGPIRTTTSRRRPAPYPSGLLRRDRKVSSSSGGSASTIDEDPMQAKQSPSMAASELATDSDIELDSGLEDADSSDEEVETVWQPAVPSQTLIEDESSDEESETAWQSDALHTVPEADTSGEELVAAWRRGAFLQTSSSLDSHSDEWSSIAANRQRDGHLDDEDCDSFLSSPRTERDSPPVVLQDRRTPSPSTLLEIPPIATENLRRLSPSTVPDDSTATARYGCAPAISTVPTSSPATMGDDYRSPPSNLSNGPPVHIPDGHPVTVRDDTPAPPQISVPPISPSVMQENSPPIILGGSCASPPTIHPTSVQDGRPPVNIIRGDSLSANTLEDAPPPPIPVALGSTRSDSSKAVPGDCAPESLVGTHEPSILSDAAPDTHAPHTPRTRIAKPSGECGKPGKGGYTLEKALKWSPDRYEAVRVSGNHHP